MSETVTTYDGRNLEELIGIIEEEYLCVYCGVNGTLFAGHEGLAFLGKFFLFDKRILLKWVDVKVQQTDHGVAFQTRENNPVVHEFSGIHHPERCWAVLVSLHNQALLDRNSFSATSTTAEEGGETPTVFSSSTNRRKQLRRMTSDPNKMSANIDDLFSKEGQDKDLGETTLIDKAISSSTTTLIASRKSVKKRPAPQEGIPDMEMDGEERLAIEDIVGKIQNKFPCVYSKQSGTLYSGSTALYFVGDRLFFCAKVVIQSKHIQQVQMLKGKSKSEQGIKVTTRNNDLSHTFLDMENPDQVWASLVDLRKHVGTEDNNNFSPRHLTLRRQNSDPNTGSRADLSSPSHHEQESHLIRASATTSGLEQATTTTTLHPETKQSHIMTETELKSAWEELQAETNRFSTVVVKDHEFACSLDKFFHAYLADDAEFSMEKYMQEKGDKDLKVSAWKPTTTKDGTLARSRVVRYIHPINQPLAPPNPRARKEQTYQRFGNYGICMETKTFVDDVPMADCFFVKDRLLVVASKDKGSQVLVTMEFELEFVKSTMFRGVITKTTTGEMSKFFLSMRDYMAKSLGEQVVEQKPEEVKEDLSRTKEVGFLLGGLDIASLVTHALLLFVIIVQFWVLKEMADIKKSIHRIETGDQRQCSYQNDGFYGEQDNL